MNREHAFDVDELDERLRAIVSSDVDFRHRDEDRRVLEVYEPAWPAGDFHRTYRT